ncbi:uncharacterized protein si:dkeyp-51f12.2 [Esox lucius]|uniref:uncharacterized protein si:dkeyp-51f12.2 n=1 Tax=Esox lucius TaxID=8010 RepID=UPI001476AAF1|nr:uncharacterized protein si:dkeyp-51f12.2 [Esox lucius]XP_034149779.1 uncharacterized protein si:dkeyp-51f12.2 [Esox lucius]
MPSLHHVAIFIGVFLIVTGGSTAFLTSSQSRLQAFSLCCVVLGAVMLILGLFWGMNNRNHVDYSQGDYPNIPHQGEHPNYPYPHPELSYPGRYGHPNLTHILFSPPPAPGSHFPGSQSALLHRNEPLRRGVYGADDVDYPPLSPPSRYPHCLGPPPPYEVAIKTTCSSTHLRRSYSDTHLASEPLFGRSREISFEV